MSFVSSNFSQDVEKSCLISGLVAVRTDSWFWFRSAAKAPPEMIEKFSNHFRDAFLTEMYCKKSDPMFAFEEVLGFRFKYRS
jgi:hypothetical protein